MQPVCAHACWCLLRPEADPPGTGVTHVCARNQAKGLLQERGSLNCPAISPALKLCLNEDEEPEAYTDLDILKGSILKEPKLKIPPPR